MIMYKPSMGLLLHIWLKNGKRLQILLHHYTQYTQIILGDIPTPKNHTPVALNDRSVVITTHERRKFTRFRKSLENAHPHVSTESTCVDCQRVEESGATLHRATQNLSLERR